MKVLTKITDTISKVAEWIIMAMILGLVGLIVTELCRRNFLNQSWLPTTELCGILFLWMAFIGIIPLYNKSGLIRLDFLVTRLHGIAAEIVWYITDLVGLGLGVVMIMAFNAQYRFGGLPHLCHHAQCSLYYPIHPYGDCRCVHCAEEL